MNTTEKNLAINNEYKNQECFLRTYAKQNLFSYKCLTAELEKTGCGVKLIIHSRLMPRLKRSGDMNPHIPSNQEE
jgi:hypothetical protein